MSDIQLTDEQARKAISTELDKTFLVEAGAGSGKTTSLVERMVSLIVSGKCRVENMAAVTFTRKAAAELGERFQVRLEELYAAEQEPQVQTRLAEALESLDRAFLGTIHSFCARLLRERPVEAGIAPDFTEIEDLEERRLQDQAWEDYLIRVRLEQPEVLLKLDELGLSPADLKEAFGTLARYPDVEMIVKETDPPKLGEAREKFEQLCEFAEMYLPKREPQKGWDGLQKLLRRALFRRIYVGLEDDREFLKLLEEMDRSPRVTLNRWLDNEGAKQVREAFNYFKEEVLGPTLRCFREYRHYHLMQFLLPAVEEYQGLRERKSSLTFQDLLMRAAALLRENPEVRKYFQDRYTHLLIDEFQDTDPIQAEVMMYLAGEELEECDWTRLHPRPGSLFVVGDPKQSIYRFRRADIDTYYQVKEQILKSGGDVLNLTTNFRSLSVLTDWINHVFANIFGTALPYQAFYQAMDPVRMHVPGAAAGVICHNLGDVKGKKEEIAELDAEETAAWIKWAVSDNLFITDESTAGKRPAVPDDFLILVRYKANMASYARALEHYGIPFTISGGSDISESGEVRELLLLLKALADPQNSVPLVAALRGMFFGVSDELLYRYRNQGGRFSLFASCPTEADAEVREVFTPVLEQLHRFFAWTRDFSPGTALEKIAAELGLLPVALAGELAKGRAGSILQAVELIRREEQRGLIGFPDAVEFLSEVIESGVEDEIDIEGGRSRGVRIMNLHKAKGLEAPVVILANPRGATSHPPELHVERHGKARIGYLTVQTKKGYQTRTLAEPRYWETREKEEEKYLEAEEDRLLYVAATRARDLLVVSVASRQPEKSPWFKLYPYLSDAEQLCFSSVPRHQEQKPKESVTRELLWAAREEMERDLSLITVPTYQHMVVTEVKGEGQERPERRHTGRGASFGNVIHRALDILAVKPATQLEALVGHLLAEEGRSCAEQEEVVEILSRVMETSLWTRLQQAEEKFTEMPFGIWEDDIYITGKMDLIFREPSGFVIVDYKSDTVLDDSHLQSLVDYYRPQVEMYRKYFFEITGEKPQEVGLFFTDVTRYMKL